MAVNKLRKLSKKNISRRKRKLNTKNKRKMRNIKNKKNKTIKRNKNYNEEMYYQPYAVMPLIMGRSKRKQ